MTSDEIYEMNGRRYRRTTSGWIDADTYVKPSLVVSRELDLRYSKPTQRTAAARPTRSAGSPRSRRAGYAFTGLVASDFRTNTEGTTWRRATTLAGLLAQTLRDKTGRDFVHHSVYRRQQVLFGEPPRFDKDNSDKFNFQPAKFFIQLTDTEARYGFYIEKPSGDRHPSSEWNTFLTAVTRPAIQTTVDWAAQAAPLRWQIEQSYAPEFRERTVWQQRVAPERWPEVVALLEAATPDKTRWIDLYLEASMSPDEAIAAGVAIAEPITAVFQSLLPVYDACARS